MLGDLARLQGLKTISPLAAVGGTTLTSVFAMGDTPANVTPPVDSPIPMQRESTFGRRPSADTPAVAPVPPPGHGGGSTDIAQCPFMALQNFVEQSQTTPGQEPVIKPASSAAGGAPLSHQFLSNKRYIPHTEVTEVVAGIP